MSLDLFSEITPSYRMLQDYWRACTLLMIATCLVPALYNWRVVLRYKAASMPVAASALTVKSGSASSRNPVSHPPSRRRKKKMRYKNRGRSRPITKQPILPTEVPQFIPRTKQPFEAFLVLDIEGTCMLGTDFNYPNEIIVGPLKTI